MVGAYPYFLKKGIQLRGVFNAGFENISVMDIANKVVAQIPAQIIVSESNDPRSSRLCSKKLLATGFKPQYGVDDAIKEIAEHLKSGNLKNEDNYYKIRTMKDLKL